MAVVTAQFLAGLYTTFSVVYEDAFQAATESPPWEDYCTLVPSTTDTESYNWLGTVPVMQEWLDERTIGGLASFTYSLKNRHWANGIAVDRDTIEDDKYNLIKPRIAQLAQEAARHPDDLATQVLVAGDSTVCYDAVNFFATTHTEEGQPTQSNLNTGTGTALANVRADFVTARTAMRRIKDGKGRPMNLRPDLVVIPPDLEDVFEQLIHTNLIATGTQMMNNVLMNAVNIQVNAYLTEVSDWFLMNTKQSIRGILMQMRKPPEFTAVDNPTDSVVWSNKTFRYGADSRYNAGYGLWQVAAEISNG